MTKFYKTNNLKQIMKVSPLCNETVVIWESITDQVHEVSQLCKVTVVLAEVNATNAIVLIQ